MTEARPFCDRINVTLGPARHISKKDFILARTLWLAQTFSFSEHSVKYEPKTTFILVEY